MTTVSRRAFLRMTTAGAAMMEVHEAPYLVRNDATPFEVGMCFSDEPGIHIPGEFGVRMEDCWYMSDAGPKLFTPLATSIERPI